MSGNITCNGDVIASGISLKDHTHGGVETGGGNTFWTAVRRTSYG